MPLKQDENQLPLFSPSKSQDPNLRKETQLRVFCISEWFFSLRSFSLLCICLKNQNQSLFDFLHLKLSATLFLSQLLCVLIYWRMVFLYLLILWNCVTHLTTMKWLIAFKIIVTFLCAKGWYGVWQLLAASQHSNHVLNLSFYWKYTVYLFIFAHCVLFSLGCGECLTWVTVLALGLFHNVLQMTICCC